MSKGSIIAIIASVLLVILLVGGLATWFGNGENPFEDIFTPDDPVDEPIVFPETEYNPTFGTNFKEDFPIANLALRDNMQVAPYAYTDTTLFSGKKITKIDAPVGTVKAVDENQYFTLWVVKSEAVKVGGDVTDFAYRQYKIYLPKEELTGTKAINNLQTEVFEGNEATGSLKAEEFVTETEATAMSRVKIHASTPRLTLLTHFTKTQALTDGVTVKSKSLYERRT